MILVNKADRFAVKNVDLSNTKSIHCILSVFTVKKGGPISDYIESITSNTQDRLRAYLAFNKAVNGTSSTLPRGDTCEK
jgi:hypothetical protein